MILAEKDIAIDNASAIRFVENAPATVKELIMHDGIDHGVLQNKTTSDKVID